MTRNHELTCYHEPFGDAFYYGPERLSSRYEYDSKAREDCGFSQSTYQKILDQFDGGGPEVRFTPSTAAPSIISFSKDFFRFPPPVEDLSKASGKRVFVKDMIYYLVPPDGNPPSIAPSLQRKKRGVGTSSAGVNGTTNGTIKAPYPYDTDAEPNNPTVIPREVLGKFHFTFLIRHPRSSIPSFYRCTIPPLDEVTGFYDFMPSEAGYAELRRVFDYLLSQGQVGPKIAGQGKSDSHMLNNGFTQEVEVCVIDADDLLDNPTETVEAFCTSVGMDYDPKMLKWDTEEEQQQAKHAFEKWPGFHDDVMNSKELKPREHNKKAKSVKDENLEWVEKYGEEGAKIIQKTVEANMEDYEYLKQYAIKLSSRVLSA
ncbi:MAG: hypothetical protein Q9210_003413 [Variospora velana]